MKTKNYIDSEKNEFKYLSNKKLEKLEIIIKNPFSLGSYSDSLGLQIVDYLNIEEIMSKLEGVQGVVVGRVIYFNPFHELREILEQIRHTLGREILKDVKNGRTSGAKSVCIALKNMKR